MRQFAGRAAALPPILVLCLGLLSGAGSALAQDATTSATMSSAPSSLPAAEPAGPSPVVARLVARLEASGDSCSALRPEHPDHRTMAAEVARFRQHVPAAAAVAIDVRECYWDGMVLGGQRIIVSTRLARATPAQRFFVIAHEYAHLSAQHHARFSDLVGQMLRQDGSATRVARALERGAASALSRRNELEADAAAVQLMLEAGIDPEEAARFLDEAARAGDQELDTHPGPRSRAAAIRALAAQRVASGVVLGP